MASTIRCACLVFSTVAVLLVNASSASNPTLSFPAGIQPIYREIGDWIVACDNTSRCVAKYVLDDSGAKPEDYDEDAGLTITRDAGPTAPLHIKITSASVFDPAGMRMDGKASPFRLAWHRYDHGRSATLDGVDALALTRRWRDARTLSSSPDAGFPKISLHGLAAVLIAMDNAQGRTGDASSLSRTDVRRTTVLPGPALPPILRPGAEAAVLRNPAGLIRGIRRSQAAVLKVHGCDQEPGVDDSAAALDDWTAIILLGCGRFAYQTSVLAFAVPLGKPQGARPLVLDDPMSSAPSDAESIGEYVGGSYDPATRVFTMFAKGRGLADCGTSASWTYDGRAFRLSSYATQQRCGGGPGGWPTLFRTRTGAR